jgi:hypothetical protein
MRYEREREREREREKEKKEREKTMIHSGNGIRDKASAYYLNRCLRA